jgi:hypothetical protein
MAWATLIMIAALLAQFVLGMAPNLFVTIPDRHPGTSPENYFAGAGHSVGWATTSGLLPLAAHVILGILLIAAGFVLIALAASSGHRDVLTASILGALFILGAAFNGGQPPQLQRRPQLHDHGRALHCGPGLLHHRAPPAQRCSGTGWDRQRGVLTGSPTGTPRG